MLKSKSVAKIIEDELNSINADEQFKILDSVGDYKGSKINGILKQGKSTITPIMNYINATVPYTLEIIVPYQCGEDRADNIVNIVNSFIKKLNGKVKVANGGKIIFLFDTINLNEYETRASVGTSAKLGVTFVVNYSNKDVGTMYEMALINNDFAGTINTRYFSSQEEQYKWYYNKITNAPFSELLTPNINSLVISQQRYINDIGTDTNELSMYNYAIIRETKEDGTINHYYYEVTNANVDQYNILSVDLKMDTLQTWYFNPNIEFDDCFIKRAHQDRFDKNPVQLNANEHYKYNFNFQSNLYKREDIRNVAKKVVNKKRLYPEIDAGSFGSNISEWFRENVSHWVYYYISGGKDYVFYRFGHGNLHSQLPNIKYKTSSNSRIDGGIVVLAAPVYKTDKRIYVMAIHDKDNHEDTIIWDELGIKRFLNHKAKFLEGDNIEKSYDNGGYANVYSIKHSVLPPFKPEDMTLYMQVAEDGLLLVSNENNGTTGIRTFRETIGFVSADSPDNATGTGYACGYMLEQDLSVNVSMKTQSEMISTLFTKSYIKTNAYSHNNSFMGLEPKLLNEDYSTYRVFIGGNSYDLPISKTSRKPSFIYKEILSPDITKAMLIYDESNSLDPSGIFNETTKTDFTGFVINIDLSMWFSTDKLQEYLANNRNNMQILNNQQKVQEENAWMGVAGGLASTILSKGTAEMFGQGIVGNIVNIGSLYNSQQYDRLNQSLTYDNMAQSPETLSSLNSNSLLIQSISGLAIYIEVQQPLYAEQKEIINQFRLNGYIFNDIGKIKDYDNSRVVFNYIEAQIDGIKGVNISNNIREDIRQRFNNGVRFWHIDTIDYDRINYEKWLEDN